MCTVLCYSEANTLQMHILNGTAAWEKCSKTWMEDIKMN